MPNRDIIKHILAREVLNSRGNPAVEAEVQLADGSIGRVAAPSGISTGTSEALELRDGDPKRYRGRGMLKAVENVHNVMAPALKGMHTTQQEVIDRRLIELDGTPNKGKLGANAILAVSLATAHAAAASQKIPLYRHIGGDGPFRLPVPTFNLIAGGEHAQDTVDFQEFMVAAVGFSSFREALRAGSEIYHALREVYRKRGFPANALGALPAPAGLSNKQTVDLLVQATENAGYRPGEECYIAMDAATSELYSDGRYALTQEKRTLDAGEMADLWAEWVKSYPITSIEDGLAEEDWKGWQALTKRLGDKVELVGDDLFTTNPSRIQKGISLDAANAVLIKLNQIGTLTETIEAVRTAHGAGYASMVSTRSGETEDFTMVELAVGMNTGQMKSAPPCIDRIIKYNRLLRIEEELGDKAEFAGKDAYKVLR
jgi:enolase